MTGFPRPDADVLDYIETHWHKGEPRNALLQPNAPARLRFECPWCGHREHGFRCTPGLCHCDSSFDRLDCTWRDPRATTQGGLSATMDATGCDGWVARYISGLPPFGHVRAMDRARVKKAMYGGRR